jgi:hypothetical protein
MHEQVFATATSHYTLVFLQGCGNIYMIKLYIVVVLFQIVLFD